MTYDEWHSAHLYDRMAHALVASSKERPLAVCSENCFSSLMAKRRDLSLSISTRSWVRRVQDAAETAPSPGCSRYATEPFGVSFLWICLTDLMRKRATCSDRITCSPSTVTGSAKVLVRSAIPDDLMNPWPPHAFRHSSMFAWALTVAHAFSPEHVACSSGSSSAAPVLNKRFGACRRRSPRGYIESEGSIGRVSVRRVFGHLHIGTGPRRSPSACSEKLLKKRVRPRLPCPS